MSGPLWQLETEPVVDAIPHDNSEETWSLGAEIRALRKVKGMTLIDFSERTGKSIGYLSQVERDITKPSHLMLQTISNALGVQIGWFYPADEDADPREQRYIVRKNSRRRLAYSDLGYTDYLGMKDYLLSPNLEGSQAMGLTTLEPQGSTGDDAYCHEGEESGYILEGSIELTIQGETFVLEAGDSYGFSSELSHRFFNVGNKRATFIWCNTPVNLRPSFKSG
jgi:transcriptional regulator with XRE-family HTH domain